VTAPLSPAVQILPTGVANGDPSFLLTGTA